MKRSIPGLEPGAAYKIRFAGVLPDGRQSHFTNIYTINVPVGTEHEAPTAASFEYSAGNIRVSWVEPVRAADFASYVVDVFQPGSPDPVNETFLARFSAGDAAFFDFTRDINASLRPVAIPNPRFKIYTKNTAGLLSTAPLVISASYPSVGPFAAPTGFPVKGGVDWKWLPPVLGGNILSRYEIDIDAGTAEPTFNTGDIDASIAAVPEPRYLFIDKSSMQYAIKVRAVDIFERAFPCTEFAVVESGIDLPTPSNTPPGQPEQPAAVGNAMQIQIVQPNSRSLGGGATEANVVGFEVFAGLTPAPTDLIGFIEKSSLTSSGAAFPLDVAQRMVSISSVTGTTTKTVVTSVPHGFLTGQAVTIAGSLPATMNETASVTYIDDTRFSYIPVSSAAWTSGGTAANANEQNWYVRTRAVNSLTLASAYSEDAAVSPGLISSSNIADATITNAKIVDLQVEKIKSGTISTETLSIGATGAVQSSNYVSGSAGFRLGSSGLNIYSASTIAGWSVAPTKLSSGKISLNSSSNTIAITTATGATPAFDNSNTPFYADDSGAFSLGNRLKFSGGVLSLYSAIFDTSAGAALTIAAGGNLELAALSNGNANYITWLESTTPRTTMHVDVASSNDFYIDNTDYRTYIKSSSTSGNTIRIQKNGGSSYDDSVVGIGATKVADTDWNLISAWSDTDASVSVNLEFRVRGDGQVTADGSFTGGGADYAECFEWLDGNPDNEDRVGVVVAVEGGKVREATAADGEAIIGVISADPVVLGDSSDLAWRGKYERDVYGRKTMEEFSVISWDAIEESSFPVDCVPSGITPPVDAVILTEDGAGRRFTRPVLNALFDPDAEYTPRMERREWAAVGLFGKLFVNHGQVVPETWLLLEEGATADRYLVR